MHADRSHIRSSLHSGNRKIVIKVKMGSVSLINKDHHSVLMSYLNDRLKVGTDSVISRIVDKDSLCFRMCKHSLLNQRNLHSEGNTYMIVHLRINIYRFSPAKNERVYNAPVNISW